MSEKKPLNEGYQPNEKRGYKPTAEIKKPVKPPPPLFGGNHTENPLKNSPKK
jgi:hypothetical protein